MSGECLRTNCDKKTHFCSIGNKYDCAREKVRSFTEIICILLISETVNWCWNSSASIDKICTAKTAYWHYWTTA